MKQSLDIRSQQRFKNFKKALALYEEANSHNMSKLEEEGLIQRFEYTFELAWKCLQDVLQERGFAEIRGPRPVIEQAFQDGLISNGDVWLHMLKARNETAHLYDEATFKAIITNVKKIFLSTLQDFRNKFPQ